MNQTTYYFLPAVRQGLATAIKEPAQEAQRAQVDGTLTAKAYNKNTGIFDFASAQQFIQLYGPGDIPKFDERIVVRTDPRPQIGNFEPNYFPVIEFSDADFAWRFTADISRPINSECADVSVSDAGYEDITSPTPDSTIATSNSNQKSLMPWITLIVLVSETTGDNVTPEFTEGERHNRNLPPYIKVNTSVLPNLECAWRWAHAHLTNQPGLSIETLRDILRSEMESTVCRLACPRRLMPKTRYTAFVVPTFKLGVLAGRGHNLGTEENRKIDALQKAWEVDEGDIELPYYYRWEFGTGMRGDFEHLVRLLEPRELTDLGKREIDCANPGFNTGSVNTLGLDDLGPHILEREGALQSLDTQYTCWGMDLRVKITETDTISNVEVQVSPSKTSVRISWETTEQLTSQIDYGETEACESKVHQSSLTQNHQLILANLEPGTTYHFKIGGRDNLDTVVQTEIGTLQIPPISSFQEKLAELINKPDIEDKIFRRLMLDIKEANGIDEIRGDLLSSGTEVQITWQTNRLCQSQIDYYDQSGSTKKINLMDFKQKHQLILRELEPDTIYYFNIIAEADDRTIEGRLEGAFRLPPYPPPLPSVVPPIYGRWHYGKLKKETSTIVDVNNQTAWIDVLNLDPRHRLAAGLGAQVIRKQQEALMASAWEQLGAIESTNDILRRAQFGRDTSQEIFQRLSELPPDKFLQITRPVQGRVIVDNDQSHNGAPERITVAEHLRKHSRIPSAALDPAFRLITKPRGFIRKRYDDEKTDQKLGDMYTRLAEGSLEAAGPPPKPAGTLRLCDITKHLRDTHTKPSVDSPEEEPSAVSKVMLTAEPKMVSSGEVVTVSWDTHNVENCTASSNPIGIWLGQKTYSGDEQVGPLTQTTTFSLTCTGPEGNVVDASITVRVQPASSGDIGEDDLGEGTVRPFSAVLPSSPAPLFSSIVKDPGLRFCEEQINCKELGRILDKYHPFEEVSDETEQLRIARIICGTIDSWLNDKSAEDDTKPPVQDDKFIEDIKANLLLNLNPAKTIVGRTKKRLRLRGDLAHRFEGDAAGDPLGPILAAPEFPQPMYEPLRDISHDLLLPGVEKIPQNTIGLLKTNRRFVEAYMCGLNHEFAGELLWREYPTDQRGSYFRQFWDVSEYIPGAGELQAELSKWLQEWGFNTIGSMPPAEKIKILRRHLDTVLVQLLTSWLIELQDNNSNNLSDQQSQVLRQLQGDFSATEKVKILRRHLDTVLDSLAGIELGAQKQRIIRHLLDENTAPLLEVFEQEWEPTAGDTLKNQINGVVKELVEQECLAEKLKDIMPLVAWRDNPLGGNQNRPGEDLVLVIRGDLLQRYPNTLIYAVDAVRNLRNQLVPGLQEYIDSDAEPKPRIFPSFRATLPPDLTFLGFCFSKDDACGDQGDNPGKFFIIEERVGEARFGLDMSAENTSWENIDWSNLSWPHFGFNAPEGDEDGNQGFGLYLDSPPTPLEANNDNVRLWANATSAKRAQITLQKPVRMAILASEMIPGK